MQGGLIIEFGDEILKCENVNKTYRSLLFCCPVYYAVKGGFNC